MEYKNYTPHQVNIHTGAEGITLAPAGAAPRLKMDRIHLGTVGGIPVSRVQVGEPEGLPAPEAGVVFIVSAMVAEACPERDDLVYPGEAIRDEAGRVVGCRGLCAGPGMARKMAK